MALKGTLKDFAIADIFQLIAHQQKTGILDLAREEEQIQIVFEEGYVIMAEPKMKRKGEKLGELLLRSGLIADKDLEEALEVQKETLQKLGDILIERNVINKDGLRKVLRLQTEETLFAVLQWTDGLYEFHQMPVRYERDIYRQISAEHVLMEGYRRLDEWKMIQNDVPTPEIVFTIGEESLPFLEEGKLNLEKREFRKLSEEEKKILAMVDGNRTVREIRDLSLLGEFEAMKALSSLLKGKYIEPVRQDTGAEAGEGALPPLQAQGYLRIAAATALVLVLWLLVLGLGFFPAPLKVGPGVRETVPSQELKIICLNGVRDQLDSALEVYRIGEGSYPLKLDDLAQGGTYVFPRFSRGLGQDLFYLNRGDNYLLLLPKI
jgi:hypothetical protein